MLRACVAALACLCLGTCANNQSLRSFGHIPGHSNKDIKNILTILEEKLRVLDIINTAQAKQSRRLDIIQDKLVHVESTLSLRLERAALATERLEHRLHMIQANVQAAVKESTHVLEKSQEKILEITDNMTSHLESHQHLLEKVSGAYAETWRRGLFLESQMRDGMTLINVTRRELADGLRAIARRQRENKASTPDIETAYCRRVNDNTHRIDMKMQDVINAQKSFLESCQHVQRDDPNQVANMLDKLVDSLINKTASTFHELQTISSTIRNHDSKISKILNTGRGAQNEATCRRLENLFRNTSQSPVKETELHQLTEKFVALTDRADAALQRLEATLENNIVSQVSAVNEADRLLFKLKGIPSEDDLDSEEMDDSKEADGMTERPDNFVKFDYENGLFGTGTRNDVSTEKILRRRHIHKHPYDRGPRDQK